MTYDPDRHPVDPDNRVAARRTGGTGTIGLILGALIVVVGLFAIYSYSTDSGPTTATTGGADTSVTGSTRPADRPMSPSPAPAAPPATAPAPAAPANR